MSQKVQVRATLQRNFEEAKITEKDDTLRLNVRHINTGQLLALANITETMSTTIDIKRSGLGITIIVTV
jgi:hypothetical protein